MTVPYGSLMKDVDDCGCGCGLAGTLKKANRAGVRCVRGCRCKSCLGRRSTKRGHGKQKKVAVVMGVPQANSLHPGHEEQWGGAVRLEVKSGRRDTGPVFTAYQRCEEQSEQARPIGDHRPFGAVFMPEGTSDGLVVVRLSNLHQFVAAMVEQWGAA